MARPKDSDSAVTFERIQRAARTLLTADGPGGITFRRVAEVAGLSPGTVRYYFASREELLESSLDSYHHKLLQLEKYFTQAFEVSDDPRSVVSTAVRAAFDFLCANKEMLRLRLLDTLSAGEMRAYRRCHAREPFYRRVSEVLARRTGRPARQLRMELDAVVQLVARHACSTPIERCSVCDVQSPAEADQLLKAFCAQTAERLFFQDE